MGARSWLLVSALTVCIAAASWNWWQKNQLKIEGLEKSLETVQGEARLNLATATVLKSTLERERETQTRLLQLQGELRAGLANRERQIESLKHENEELRNWADQPLPDAARRLRERPALTGGAAYHQWLSGGGAVPVAGDGAVEERPVAQ